MEVLFFLMVFTLCGMTAALTHACIIFAYWLKDKLKDNLHPTKERTAASEP